MALPVPAGEQRPGPLGEGALVCDASGAVLAADDAAHALLEAPATARLLAWDGAPLGAGQHPAALAVARGQRVAGLTLGVRLADGSPRWLAAAAEPLWQDGTRPVAALVGLADVSERHRVALEHRALSRLSRAVIAGRPEYEVCDLAAAEAARLIGVDGGGVARFAGDEHIEVMGSWGAMQAGGAGSLRRLVRGSELARVRATGLPVRSDGLDACSGSPLTEYGISACVVVPIRVDGRAWAGWARSRRPRQRSRRSPSATSPSSPTCSPSRSRTRRRATRCCARPRPTRSPACSTTASSRSGSRSRSSARIATAAR